MSVAWCRRIARDILVSVAVAGCGASDAVSPLGVPDIGTDPDGSGLPGRGGGAGSGVDADVWRLIFADEFDDPGGTPPDADAWVHDVGGHGWGNAQLEYNTDRTHNAAHDGLGRLVMTARRESFAGNAYTSARIKTQRRFEHMYGRFEARIQVPVGRGLWPAFWMIGNNIDVDGWPKCGEIDVVEYRGHEPSVLHGSVHGPGFSGASPITRTYALPGRGFDENFHVFAVDWDPARIVWFVDGQVYHEVAPSDLPSEAEWVFDHPFFMVLNLAVGGRFPGPPDPETQFPAELLVDYVRVYDRK